MGAQGGRARIRSRAGVPWKHAVVGSVGPDRERDRGSSLFFGRLHNQEKPTRRIGSARCTDRAMECRRMKRKRSRGFVRPLNKDMPMGSFTSARCMKMVLVSMKTRMKPRCGTAKPPNKGMIKRSGVCGITMTMMISAEPGAV
jgi:hypothetical protein